MTGQWKEDVIERFTNLRAFVIKGYTPFKLPPADVYIINYHCLAKWISVLAKMVKCVVFDECQELRKADSQKWQAAQNISNCLKYAWGLSGTPIYNYGDEIFNILNCIREGCMGEWVEFCREWCGSAWSTNIQNPKALGYYLREKFLMLRRTTKEIGRELPEVNRIVMPVEYDEDVVKSTEELMRTLAINYLTSTNFSEKGELARELNTRLRQTTGIAKARHVAAMVRILLDNEEPVLLSGWHRDVYDIWMQELKEYNPVMYTGSETVAQKEQAKRDFVEGKTNLFIISNRSGVGLDGLQHRCRYVVVGELDWSPKVHDQIIARVSRDGQPEQVTVIFPVCDYGSDPGLVEVLGLKSSESRAIVDPSVDIEVVYSDENRIKVLAETYLKRSGIALPKQTIVTESGELKQTA
jgi:hypothetical protein